MLVSIAVILIMVSLNAPSLLTKIGLIRPRLNSPRMEAVVEEEVVDAAAEVALLVEAVANPNGSAEIIIASSIAACSIFHAFVQCSLFFS